MEGSEKNPPPPTFFFFSLRGAERGSPPSLPLRRVRRPSPHLTHARRDGGARGTRGGATSVCGGVSRGMEPSPRFGRPLPLPPPPPFSGACHPSPRPTPRVGLQTEREAGKGGGEGEKEASARPFFCNGCFAPLSPPSRPPSGCRDSWPPTVADPPLTRLCRHGKGRRDEGAPCWPTARASAGPASLHGVAARLLELARRRRHRAHARVCGGWERGRWGEGWGRRHAGRPKSHENPAAPRPPETKLTPLPFPPLPPPLPSPPFPRRPSWTPSSSAWWTPAPGAPAGRCS